MLAIINFLIQRILIHSWHNCTASIGKPRTGKKKAGTNKQVAFYEGVFCTAQFFINSELPVTMSKFDAIAASGDTAMGMPEVSFGT